MVRLNNVSFGYTRDSLILNGINLEIKDGSFFGICGRSASGKTTLAKLICGLLKPTEGTIEVSEQPRLVMQFPERQLFAKTVLEDVMYGPLNQGKSTQEAQEIARKTLKSLGLREEILNKSPFAISGGEKRLVAIAGILAMESGILVLDEPTAGLDESSRKALIEILRKLNEEGRTIILISHDERNLEYCTDRIQL
ncbi:MAG: ATP-binding cassette domain-containing protein [Spirochaetales bacterium]|nr:ATP-binding cassette domain-containing protein [Spirochaetales bacterium]